MPNDLVVVYRCGRRCVCQLSRGPRTGIIRTIIILHGVPFVSFFARLSLYSGSRLRPKTLQAVDVPIIDNRQCERWHKSNGINVIIYDEMMCAGYREGSKDSCQVSETYPPPRRKSDYDTWPTVYPWNGARKTVRSTANDNGRLSSNLIRRLQIRALFNAFGEIETERNVGLYIIMFSWNDP